MRAQRRNRNITKRDTEQLIRAIWSTKQDEDRNAARRGIPPPSLNDHIYQHFRVRFGNFSNIIAEWGYNLLEGCRRYVEDADIELFKVRSALAVHAPNIAASTLRCCEQGGAR